MLYSESLESFLKQNIIICAFDRQDPVFSNFKSLLTFFPTHLPKHVTVVLKQMQITLDLHWFHVLATPIVDLTSKMLNFCDMSEKESLAVLCNWVLEIITAAKFNIS